MSGDIIDRYGEDLFKCLDESTSYELELAKIVESRPQQQSRKNKILDHLLARFGERFTDYVLGLYTTSSSLDVFNKDYDDYLNDKSDFLEVIASLNSERAQGYDIKAISPNTLLPDVWESRNVSGLKKRVCRLLGISDYRRKSLICKSEFDIEIKESYSKNDRLQYELLLQNYKGETLLSSPNPLRKKKEDILELRELLYSAALNEGNYEIEEVLNVPEERRLVIKEKSGKVIVQSKKMETADAEQLLQRMLKMAVPEECDVEGFHIVEHILFRPNDKNDELLGMPARYDVVALNDPYSFWLTVILPDWVKRFKNAHFRRQFEHIFRMEAPAHIAVRFCWVDNETMIRFENHYKKWLVEKAKCTPDECEVNEFANEIIKLLNNMQCSNFCASEMEPFVDRCAEKM